MRRINPIVLLLALLSGACGEDPQEKSRQYLESAEQYLTESRYEEAVIQYRNAIQNDEQHVPAYLGLARAFQKLGNHQQALNQFMKVLELDPDNVEAKLEVGDYHLQAGAQNPENYVQARKLAEEVLAQEPASVRARILLGNAFAGLNDLNRSLQEMQQALREDPDNLTAHLNLGALELRSQDREKALQTFQEAVRRHPDSPDAHRAIGNFYLAVAEFEKAEGFFRRALELAPEENANLYSLVRHFLVTRQPEKVEGLFREIIRSQPDAREPRWGLANYLIGEGREAEGIELLKELIRADSQDRFAALRLAEVYLSQQRLDDAEALIEERLSSNKNDSEAHYLKGKLLLARNDGGHALREFDLAIQNNPALTPAYLEKAALHLKQQEFSRAEETLRGVLSRDEGNLAARAGLAKILALTRRPDDALLEADRVLERDAANVDALTARGEALLSQNRLEQSKKAFEKLNQLQPDNPFFLHRLGSIEILQEHVEQGLRFFEQALSINPDLSDVLNDLVFVRVRQGRYQAALEELDRWASRTSYPDMIHVLRGQVFSSRGDHQEAEAEFRKAIEKNPDNFQPYLFLGQLNLMRNDFEQAVREVNQLIARNRDFAPAYLLKAYYLEVAEDTEGAIENYRKTLQLAPENPVAANNLAWILCEREQKLDEALSLAQSARKSDPENRHYADTLGWVHYKLGNYTLAVDQLLFSVNKGGAGAGNYFRLGMAYYKQGNPLQAKQSLRKALELEPSFENAAEARDVLRELG